MNLEKEFETVQRFIHNERQESEVTTALERIETELQNQYGEIPDSFIDLDQSILNIIENGYSYDTEQTAQAALDRAKSEVLD